MSTIVARVGSSPGARKFTLDSDTEMTIYGTEGDLIVRVRPTFEHLHGCFPSATIRSFSYNGIVHRWFVELPAPSSPD